MRPHFKLNVLEGDMVSFTEAFLLLAREGGGKDFEHPVQIAVINLQLKNNNKTNKNIFWSCEVTFWLNHRHSNFVIFLAYPPPMRVTCFLHGP